MSFATLGLLLLAQFPASPQVVPAVCESCGVRLSAIGATIDRLKSSPRPRVREEAAADLARVRWTCHPEVVHALADSLLFDRKDDVRETSAESLARLGACDPSVHFALRRAAVADRDGAVRREARKALASLPARCIADCPLCGPSPEGSGGVLPPGESIVPGSVTNIETLPNRAETRVTPPEDVPPPPPTPVPSPIRSTRIVRPQPSSEPPPSPVPIVAAPRSLPDVAVRRSSAKPVIPPTDLPPLEGPSR